MICAMLVATNSPIRDEVFSQPSARNQERLALLRQKRFRLLAELEQHITASENFPRSLRVLRDDEYDDRRFFAEQALAREDVERDTVTSQQIADAIRADGRVIKNICECEEESIIPGYGKLVPDYIKAQYPESCILVLQKPEKEILICFEPRVPEEEDLGFWLVQHPEFIINTAKFNSESLGMGRWTPGKVTLEILRKVFRPYIRD